MIYAIVGILVWKLVNHLRSKQEDLATSLVALESAKEQLLIEEKLAAVGRFSSAIAHEIRNPVAMISSALSTAFKTDLNSAEREQMFEIAAKEAIATGKAHRRISWRMRGPGLPPNSPTMSQNGLDTSATYAALVLQKGESASIQKPPQVYAQTSIAGRSNRLCSISSRTLSRRPLRTAR